MKRVQIICCVLLSVFFLTACNNSKNSASSTEPTPDTSVAPELTSDLEINSPQGPLGNFVADGLLEYSVSTIDDKISFCLTNNSLLNSPLKKGPLTKEKVDQLFKENPGLALLVVTGKDLEAVCKAIVGRAILGDPSQMLAFSGVSIRATKTGVVKEMLLNGKEIDAEGQYRILVTSNLLAGQGDLAMLSTARQIGSKFKVKEAFTKYISTLSEPIEPMLDQRFILEL